MESLNVIIASGVKLKVINLIFWDSLDLGSQDN